MTTGDDGLLTTGYRLPPAPYRLPPTHFYAIRVPSSSGEDAGWIEGGCWMDRL
ncbi:MAG: hypothetical protein U9R58_16355 [Chloroflexota bacterium]|nr:hypothetical protein [Chloroflexota bacterium]